MALGSAIPGAVVQVHGHGRARTRLGCRADVPPTACHPDQTWRCGLLTARNLCWTGQWWRGRNPELPPWLAPHSTTQESQTAFWPPRYETVQLPLLWLRPRPKGSGGG